MNGELNQELAHALEQHLQTCMACPPLYAGLTALRGRLRELPSIVPSYAIELRIAQKVRQALDKEQ